MNKKKIFFNFRTFFMAESELCSFYFLIRMCSSFFCFKEEYKFPSTYLPYSI
ncbi:hypothetical protein C1646_712996 [Rhizophagus diaphanus]|nr:hypothetical protein C1646_712996 [Rhizophagus diaphanus] [Rhizophagus sp. MUCL 43196]